MRYTRTYQFVFVIDDDDVWHASTWRGTLLFWMCSDMLVGASLPFSFTFSLCNNQLTSNSIPCNWVIIKDLWFQIRLNILINNYCVLLCSRYLNIFTIFHAPRATLVHHGFGRMCFGCCGCCGKLWAGFVAYVMHSVHFIVMHKCLHQMDNAAMSADTFC